MKESIEQFDKEAEKSKRKEIRKIFADMIFQELKSGGFKKESYSTWSRREGNKIKIVYLQRSYLTHEYFIEAGICDPNKIPEGKKPDIVYCGDRERIENIVEEMEKDQKLSEETQGKVKSALEFQIPGVVEEYLKRDDEAKYEEGFYFPSVSLEEAKNKIEVIRKVFKDYVPSWLERHSAAKK